MYAYKRSNRLSVENRVEAKIMIYSYKIHDLECFLKRAAPQLPIKLPDEKPPAQVYFPTRETQCFPAVQDHIAAPVKTIFDK